MSKSGMTATPQDHTPESALILLVDDDPSVRFVLQQVLHYHGYQVEAVATIEEAEKIKRRLGPEAIGVVVADIHLTTNPRFHEGYAMYEHWTRLHPTLPFLLISGVVSSQRLPAVRTGAVAFLSKPFVIEEFLEILQQLLKTQNDRILRHEEIT